MQEAVETIRQIADHLIHPFLTRLSCNTSDLDFPRFLSASRTQPGSE